MYITCICVCVYRLEDIFLFPIIIIINLIVVVVNVIIIATIITNSTIIIIGMFSFTSSI